MPTNALHRSLILMLVLCLSMTGAGRCDEPLKGPLPEKQREIIHYLADRHDELRRKVTIREDGYEASTTTENEALAAKLKEHFTYMQKRMGSGAMVRRWDPAFVELVKFHDQITTEVEHLDNGIRVVVVGKTPEAVKVAQNHARIVTGFTKKGADAVSERHAPVLGDGKRTRKAEQ